MVTMSQTELKVQQAQRVAEATQIFQSWAAAPQKNEESENIFLRLIAATGASFQKMHSDRESMELVMDNELNIAQTCTHLMDERELEERLARARSLNSQQQALLKGALAIYAEQRNQASDPAYTMFLRVVDEEQMQALIALYGPSFIQ